MTTDNTIFDPEDGDKDLVAELVGEGKKFKDVNDLAKGKLEADRFIKKLQDELQTLRDMSADRDSIRELSAKLDAALAASKHQSGDPTPPGKDQRGSGTDDNPNRNQSAKGTDDVVKEVLEKIDSQKAQERANANRQEANRLMVQAYGDKAKEALASRAETLGVTVEYLKGQAEASPSVFAHLMGIDASRSRSAGGDFARGSHVPPSGEAPRDRTQKYYDALKKEMGAKKFAFDKRLQVQLHKDMTRLGNDFFDA